jgi:hypothetical protein
MAKVSARTVFLCKTVGHIPLKNLAILANALVYPHLIYVLPLWSHYSKTVAEELIAKQRNLSPLCWTGIAEKHELHPVSRVWQSLTSPFWPTCMIVERSTPSRLTRGSLELNVKIEAAKIKLA